MTADDLAATYEATVARFSDDLETEGFKPKVGTQANERRWVGQVRAGSSTTSCEIVVGEQFPFVPARVFLPQYTDNTSWHRERDGALCLWAEQDRAGLPWLDGKRLREKVEAWIDSDSAGWPNQPPALDLEAYLESDDEPRFVLVDDWSRVAGRWLTFKADEMAKTKISVDQAELNTAHFRKNRAATIGVAVDIGEQDRPLHEWADLAEQLDGSLRSDIVSWARARGQVIVIARYSVSGEDGVLAGAVRLGPDDAPKLTGLVAADSGDVERSLRGGLTRDRYESMRIAIIGLGAVGSFLADQLARAGVGKLLLYDSDILYPGNLIRHLCQPPLVGLPKATAVKMTIDARRYPGPVEVLAKDKRLSDLKVAIGLLSTYDLVIDATGDGAMSHLLLEAAKRSTGAREYLAVAVEGGGQFARVEIVPTPTGHSPLSIAGVSPFPMLISGGCGSPISPTPPSAVVSTAALGSRLALAMLRGESIGAGRRESLEPIP